MSGWPCAVRYLPPVGEALGVGDQHALSFQPDPVAVGEVSECLVDLPPVLGPRQKVAVLTPQSDTFPALVGLTGVEPAST